MDEDKTVADEELITSFIRAKQRILFLDYDGTLVPFPTSARIGAPDPDLLDLLNRLSKLPHINVQIVSGRPREKLESFFADVPHLSLCAEHGAFFREHREASWQTHSEVGATWLRDAKTILSDIEERFQGAELEIKEAGLTLHLIRCSSEARETAKALAMKALWAHPEISKQHIAQGRTVVEARPAQSGKGDHIRRVLQNSSDGLFLFAAGDDRTDEDMFEALPGHAWTYHVGGAETLARNRVKDPSELRSNLMQFIVRSKT